MNRIIIFTSCFLFVLVSINPCYATSEKSRVGAATGDIGAMNSAIALYHVDTNKYPTTLYQLVSDNSTGWSGPYMATITTDPWGYEYMYESHGDSYTAGVSHAKESGLNIIYHSDPGVFEQLDSSQVNLEWMADHTPWPERWRREIAVVIQILIVAIGIYLFTLIKKHKSKRGMIIAISFIFFYAGIWLIQFTIGIPRGFFKNVLKIIHLPALYIGHFASLGEFQIWIILLVGPIFWGVIGYFIGYISEKPERHGKE